MTRDDLLSRLERLENELRVDVDERADTLIRAIAAGFVGLHTGQLAGHAALDALALSEARKMLTGQGELAALIERLRVYATELRGCDIRECDLIDEAADVLAALDALVLSEARAALAEERKCIACAEGNHALCLGGKCECIHEPGAALKGQGDEGPRRTLLEALAAMPDEAFGWLLMKILHRGIWPEGRGGFRPESREAMARVEAEVQKLVEGPPAPPTEENNG